jgi:multidrug efflux pump subunit AcrB
VRNKFFLWAVSALLLIAGCANDEIVEEQPTPEVEGSTLVITASMPGESPETRVNLQPEQG